MINNEALNMLLARDWTIQVATERGEVHDTHFLRLVPPPGYDRIVCESIIRSPADAADPKVLRELTKTAWEGIHRFEQDRRINAAREMALAEMALERV